MADLLEVQSLVESLMFSIGRNKQGDSAASNVRVDVTDNTSDGGKQRFPVVRRVAAVHGVYRLVGDVKLLLLDEDDQCRDGEINHGA